MTKFKIQLSRLKKFLSYITLDGKTSDNKRGKIVREFKITADGGCLNVRAMDKTFVVYENITLKNVEIEEEGSIVIPDADTFEKYLSTLNSNDIIEIESAGAFITLKRDKPRKTIRMRALQEVDDEELFTSIADKWTFSPTSVTSEKSNLNTVVKTVASYIFQIVTDSQIFERDFYPLEIVEQNGEKALKITIGEGNMDSIETIIPTKELTSPETFKCQYGFGFDNIFGTISGDVTMFFAKNRPMWIIGTDGEVSFHYMMAPRVEE